MRKPYKPLCLQPARPQGGASVQQGLSAAYEFRVFFKHRRAADKRYSLNIDELRMSTLLNRLEMEARRPTACKYVEGRDALSLV